MGRLLELTSDNHQRWLWFVHVLTFFLVVSVAITRFFIKRMYREISDLIFLLTHLVYFIYWMVMLFALLAGVGKSNEAVSDANEVKASKLVLASRILLVVCLALEKQSTIFLIQLVFTKKYMKKWHRVIVSLGLCQLLIGSLIISVGCSPSRTIYPGDAAQCPDRSARWILFTLMEAILDVIMILPVANIVIGLQTNIQNKVFAIAVFVARITVWIPSILHLVYFINFIDDGRDVIDIVPTIVIEEIWICIALTFSSVPVLLRVTKKFTTLGVQIPESTIHGLSSASKTKGSKGSQGGTSSFKMKNVAAMSGLGSSDQKRLTLRPERDDGLNTIHIGARDKGEGAASIGSESESRVGILKHVDFEVSSENT